MNHVPEYLHSPSASPGQDSSRSNSRLTVLLAVTAAALALCLCCAVLLLLANRSGHGRPGDWNAQQQRKLAVKLQTDGLAAQAVDAFKACLQFDIPGPERASIAFAIANLYFDSGDYANALAWFNCVEIADPNASVMQETARRSITCLERLGRSVDAQYALAKHSALNPDTNGPPARAVTVARFGSETITLGDIADEIQRMPESMRDRFASPAAKEELLRQLITQRLLANKARKLGYDKNPDVLRQLGQVEDQLIVNQLLVSEAASAVNVDQSDLKLYYEAHKDQFTSLPGAALSCITFMSPDAARAALNDLSASPGNLPAVLQSAREENRLVESTVTAAGSIPGLGSFPALAAAALRQKQGLITNLFTSSKGPFLAAVNSVHPGNLMPFDQVASRVEQLYRQQKEQELIQSMIEKEFSVNNVRVFRERLQDGNPSAVPADTSTAEEMENE